MSIRTQLQAAFLDYINNYLTPAKFAEHNGITEDQANTLIALGREVHEGIVADYKAREPVRNAVESDEDFAKRYTAWQHEGEK